MKRENVATTQQEQKTTEWFIGIVRNAILSLGFSFWGACSFIASAASLSTKRNHWMEIKKAWWQIIVFLFSRLSLWVVIKVCQMCHWKLPCLKLSTRMDGNNYWNIPIVPSTETRKDSRLKGENFHQEKLGEWNWAEIRFSRCLCSVTNENFWWIMDGSSDSFCCRCLFPLPRPGTLATFLCNSKLLENLFVISFNH